MKITPVILCGGSGTRLWPLSRKDHPKQYLSFVGDKTMLQETILRLRGLDNITDPIIVCNSDHRFLVAEQCQQIDITNVTILLEPVAKNTAPAIVAAALQSLKKTDNASLLILSADHVIQDVDALYKAINIANQQVLKNKLTTFGILPTCANTEYGYIKLNQESINGVYKVDKFIEKPNFKKAKKYLEHGDYLWNSGMFMFKAKVLISELTIHAPEMVISVSKAINNAELDLDFIRLSKNDFELSPSDSIDYALMEKSKNVFVVPLDAKWNDIGSWPALYDAGIKDRNCNVIKGDVLAQDTTNSYINANHHMVATIGIDNLIVVDTHDATFIATKEKAREVNSIVEYLKSKGRNEGIMHRKVYRPWGWYDSIEAGLHFQVKRLFIKPGAKLSLQMHYKRAEHWVVVGGNATVIKGEKIYLLKEGESIYIPIGTKHSLENKTNERLEIIEVQSGSYLGEDDILRLEDIYSRV
ncbi:mannose-1-phosphate guanylyltransferase/mannose-6-phosphate isomerase [Methylophilaceae bacterium]|nr:mannose-1-phosphate guanylyltransferase/mannose-6-phosphate isomerase [Methylophilaceae bacterium]